jgi:hypothetical protein
MPNSLLSKMGGVIVVLTRQDALTCDKFVVPSLQRYNP